MGSETGVVDLGDKTIVQKGRLGPGQMLAVDLETGQLLDNWAVKEDAAQRFPYADWLREHRSTYQRSLGLRSAASENSICCVCRLQWASQLKTSIW